MLLVTVSDFRSNLSKYLQLAATELVSVKTKHGIFNITPNTEVRTNPSPSNDPWFDVPENIEAMKRGIADARAGKTKKFSDEELKELLGL